jgi:hypothetical protein
MSSKQENEFEVVLESYLLATHYTGCEAVPEALVAIRTSKTNVARHLRSDGAGVADPADSYGEDGFA